MIGRFYARLGEVVEPLAPTSALDAGCGEGETLARLDCLPRGRTAAIDLSEQAVQHTRDRVPWADASVASVTDLPFEDGSFDLVLCLEVLEHLAEPEVALDELARVASSDVVVSTPHEPWFQLGSLLRGKYLRGLGNHPEHVNHWNRRTLPALLETRFREVRPVGAFPWLIAHCRGRRD
ncbi:MAG TPA: class I SAM-dependent methyltransferase [Solirubrobacterales bacterium]|nr:class I SAM-dependent methyltransferase [Solirubrobacterales bacterium]